MYQHCGLKLLALDIYTEDAKFKQCTVTVE